MATECVEQQEWIEENISKPVDQWVDKTEKKCKQRHWYDPRGWFCWLVTTLIKVVVWVVVKVGKWVVRTVCKVVGAIVDFVVNVVKGLFDFFAGIFTLDWRRILDGLIEILAGVIDAAFTLARVLFLLDTLDYIITEIQRGQLKTYIRTKLGFKYSGQDFQDIIDNLRIDYGAFGYRISMRAVRTFLDSETESPDEPGVPNLVVLNERNEINLHELCGFDFTEGFWNRKRYKTLKKGLHASGGGAGELDDPISEDELNTYLNSRGAEGPKFIVLCMRDGVLETRLRAAELTGREIGLMPQWTQATQEVTLPTHIKHRGYDTPNAETSLVCFLSDIIMRRLKVRQARPGEKQCESSGALIDETEALADLCTPVAVGIFRYTDGLRGLTACLEGSASGQAAHNDSGLTFIDNKPDIVWKYVTIHELGHYFGLSHVAGVDRIMFTPKGPHGESLGWWEVVKKSFTWWTLPKLLLTKGEPTFTLDEGMQAWDYIIDNFPLACLTGHKAPPVIIG
jgi:hypothetical protein